LIFIGQFLSAGTRPSDDHASAEMLRQWTAAFGRAYLVVGTRSKLCRSSGKCFQVE